MKNVEKHTMLKKQFNIEFVNYKGVKMTISYGKWDNNEWYFWSDISPAMYHGKKSMITNMLKEVKDNSEIIREYIL